MANKRKTAAKAGKSKPERKKANGKAKPSAEVMSDQQRQTLCFSHARKIKPLLATKKEAADAVSKAFELAKKEGITRKEIELKIALETGEGIEKIKSEVERTQRVARWMGVGKQIDLFPDHETQAQRHYEDGRRAALNDQPAKPPAHLANKDANTWLEGHSAGRTSLNMTRASGFKPLSETVNDLMDKAGVTAAIESGAPAVEPEGATAH